MKPQNKYHGNAEYTDMSKEDWEDCWGSERTFFHKGQYHPFLVKHIDKLIAGRSCVKIFMPLCGKSLDIKMLYEMGHTVVGVEGAKVPIEQYFVEHNLPVTKSDCPAVKGALYQSSDSRIRIYHCNMFDFSHELESDFGAVWDRGSFGAINKTDRPKYVKLVTSMLTEDFKYLLDSMDYNPEQYSGPPHCLTPKEVESFFADKCDVKTVDCMDANNEEKREKGVEYFNEMLYYITPKCE